MSYCTSLYRYTRRPTREVLVGNVGIGGDNPIRIQSMLTSDTRDTASCVREALGLAEAGCEIIRLTAQTKQYAANLENIVRELRAAGCHTPLVADIHFKPDAAMEAAKWVEKIRINPGNFVDKKKFLTRDYTEEEYQLELEKIRDEFSPLVQFCKENGRSMRLGANHGSLSDRIMNRFGDSPEGMVESALEFAHIARELDYHQLVFSMKASNVKVMIAAYRLLAQRLEELGSDWNYPIHLGVTEAGEGEDGRIKSAMGIGSLLSDGIGDTLRVSLTEDAIYEVPVAYALAQPYQPSNKPDAPALPCPEPNPSYSPLHYSKRRGGLGMAYGTRYGWDEPVRVVLPKIGYDATQKLGEFRGEIALENLDLESIDPRNAEEVAKLTELNEPTMVTVRNDIDMDCISAFRLLAANIEERHPILLKNSLSSNPLPTEEAQLKASINLGSLLCDGIGDAILIQGEADPERAALLAYNILQAAGARISKTEFISCPSCGRTLYNIQEAVGKIRAATGHLKGVKIAIMGCIVNGPGEMADADFGYVGGAPNKINLYVGKTPVQHNIPQEEALPALIALIKSHNKWNEPN